MAAHNELGRWGEDLACRYMKDQGWYIRHRNWSDGHNELDIVCIDEEATMLVFVEVKTRSTDAFGQPYEAVDDDKRRRILSVAHSYRRQHLLDHIEWRYDIISIVGSPSKEPVITHIKHALI